MSKLRWISDKNLNDAVSHLLDIAAGAKLKAKKDFGKNVVDPFSAIIEMVGFNLSFDNWIKSEEARQSQKTLQNSIGIFHQKILGSCKGWTNLNTGNIVDLVNTKGKVIAEVKNKHNTISGGLLAGLYYSLESAVMPKTSVYKDYTAYFVEVIPKKAIRYNKPFTPSDKETGKKCQTNQLIRQIDGASFYELVTGSKTALENLYYVLPDVIKEITKVDILDRAKLKALFKLAYA